MKMKSVKTELRFCDSLSAILQLRETEAVVHNPLRRKSLQSVAVVIQSKLFVGAWEQRKRRHPNTALAEFVQM